MVSGKGAAQLEAAGIVCEQLSLPEVNEFYKSYHHWQNTQRPFITAKIALSMNGVIAGQEGERIQITGPSLSEFTHYSRKTSDAILTTVQTIIHDDPALNARYLNEIIAKPIYILDSQLKLPKQAKILSTARTVTVFYDETLRQALPQLLGVRYIPILKTQQGLNLEQIIQFIGKDGVHDLWVEAGGKCFSSLVQEKLLQRAFIYIAPRWFVNGQTAFPNGITLDDAVKINWQQLGNDVLCDVRW